MDEADTGVDTETPVTAGPSGWQPLPARARALYVLATAPLFALPAGVAGLVAGTLLDLRVPALAVVGAALAGAVLGAWVGVRRYRYSFWRHDRDGLAVRRGRWWQHETRVPASRVQHLDLKRGPLQRRRGLATLVVHTAGTRHSAVSVQHLDDADAQRLREVLARQIDHDDEE